MHTDKTSAQKLAISRALGAAFLTHQVEQLEKSVQRDGRGDGHRDYKDRHPSGRGRRGGQQTSALPPSSGRKREPNGKEDRTTNINKPHARGEADISEKEADVVVLDASVLIHCLSRVKSWCRKGRQEILVVPLEALNTLDSLKKGSSSLAQKARAASRLLEAQVGSNPRIRVQRDDAFVPWDNINFKNSSVSNYNSSPPNALIPPPEWLRRTICCAQWEVRNATAGGTLTDSIPNASTTLLSRPITPVSNETSSTSSAAAVAVAKETEKPVAEAPMPPIGNESTKIALAVMNNGIQVPSDPAYVPGSRYDRADGSLVRIWSRKAGIELILVEPTALTTPSSEKKRGGGQGQDKRDYRDGRKPQDRRPSLVEKPISIAIVNEQPAKNLRLLARGEKLDP